MKKLTSLLSFALIFAMMASMFCVGASAAAGDTDTWDGTADTSWYDPTKTSFTISTAEQLAGIAELSEMGLTFADITFRLTSDIVLNTGDASNWDLLAPTYEWTKTIGSRNTPFSGVFDGQGHTISGLYINQGADMSKLWLGLFGSVSNDLSAATVKNLNLINSYINAPRESALLVGRIGGLATIENCHVEGTAVALYGYPDASKSDSYVGGVIGWIANDSLEITISRCSFSGYVEGFVRVGGIFGGGGGTYVLVKDCWSDAKVVTGNRGGGIGGHSRAAMLEMVNCAFFGEIVHHTKYAKNYGAIMGGYRTDLPNTMTITDCYYDAKFYHQTDDGKLEELPARVAVSETSAPMTEDSTWYTPMDDKSSEPTGNDADGCEAEVTVKGDGAKEAFIAKLDTAIWDTATLTLKPITVNEAAEPDPAPAETTAPLECTTGAPTEETTTAPEETKAPDDTKAPETTKAPEADDTTAAPDNDITEAPAESGCGSMIGGGIVVTMAILGCAWVSKRR